MPIRRREFLVQSACAAFALGCGPVLSPAGIAAASGPASRRLRVLSDEQASTYAAWCDVLAPGAGEAGVARFVDRYLSRPEAESLLLLRYLGTPPFDGFYTGGIAGIDTESRARFGARFVELRADGREAVVEAAASGSTLAWPAPDAGFFYFVSRSDAIDVVYGTMEGFRKLGVPYLAHIRPDEAF